jgi:hypothetical protein
MIPVRVLELRLFHPLPPELVGSALLAEEDVALLAEAGVEPTLLAEEGVAVATESTEIVVVDVGELGSISSVLPSQVSINATMVLSYAA